MSAVLGAFGIFVDTLIALCFGGRRCHIHFLFSDFVLILLFPTVCLCRFELCGSKASFFAVFHAEIFFFGFVLPFPVFIQWTHCQHDVGVRIVTGWIGVMNRYISTHPVCNKLVIDKIG